VRAALAVTVDGEPLFRTVQSTYNVLETSAGPALAEAHDAGLTVIVKEGMANGRLAGPDAPEPLRAVAEEAGLGCDAVALAYVLLRSWPVVVLSRAASVVLAASNMHAPMHDVYDYRLACLEALAEDPATCWEKRGQLPWHWPPCRHSPRPH